MDHLGSDDDGESRAYRLKGSEPVPEGIARIARGRIDHAVDELGGKTDSTAEEAVHEARKDLHAERVKTGKPPLPASRIPERWETAINPVAQIAIVRTAFSDGTSEETQIPRTELARIIQALQQTLKRFEIGAEMRQ